MDIQTLKHPFFSIIIPTFNSAKTVQKCIESVIYQTFTNFEVLIIDGVSSDNTLQIASDFSDSRIKILSEPDKGIYDAMNKGIKLAIGGWLYFLGSDDSLYDENVLADVTTEIHKHKVDVIYGNVLMMQSGLINDGEFNFTKIQTDPICHQAIFYKKKVFEIFGGYNLRYKVYADSDLNLKWFFSKKLKNIFFERIIAKYAETGFSSIQADLTFYEELPEKLIRLGKNKLSFDKLKEHATFAAINNKKNGKVIKYIYYRTIYFYLRILSILNRKIN